ncbi:hypothetical protein GLP21_01085 [Photobacterium carnosum]|uniref:hypothetical protein n=1 Tax=Photobacterium carnosum TaxID=2023717 RepID=UPI001E5972F3|nr:hypothetical protein [Photobacterium carnosum]MCD9547271.1 hypothetical protein [Photobacterium carnosum]MCF2304471.1 hypothetical protein [Photobacterium carnosum]
MFLFNTNLRVGDIILVRGAKKHSKIIAKLTDGHFSHAMISLENDIFLEAITGSGVQTTSSLRVSIKDISNVVVLRCKFPDEQTELRTLVYISQNYAGYQGRRYSYKGAMEAIKKSGGNKTNGGYFCSHLIAAIYTDAGFPLLKKPEYKVTPNELLESTVLEDITDKVISPYSDIALKRIRDKGDEVNCIDARGETLSKDAHNHNKLLETTKKYFIRYAGVTPHRCGDFLDILTDSKNDIFAKKLDYQLSKAYRKIGINEYIRSEIERDHFEEDESILMSEIELFGYEYANELYGSYNYLLVTKIVKFLNEKSNLDNFQIFYDKWKFKYFALKVEYITLNIEAVSSVMDNCLNTIKAIEYRFPDKFDELQETKVQTVRYVVNKQVEPEQKAALVAFLLTFDSKSV